MHISDIGQEPNGAKKPPRRRFQRSSHELLVMSSELGLVGGLAVCDTGREQNAVERFSDLPAQRRV